MSGPEQLGWPKVKLDLREQLYRHLPGVWRERDRAGLAAGLKGQLESWLDAHGTLLTQLHRTLVQMMYDHFPDEAGVDANDQPGACQTWLLPYFAQLLDVAVVSPDVDGQRAEIANAVAWRQRKGTRVAVEQIAEQVGRFEVEIQEGWRRVAVTPRVDRPLLPARALGEPVEMDLTTLPPTLRAEHPDLPTATLDLRRASRAVRCPPGTPTAHTTRFSGTEATWRIAHRHGVPCLPDSYQDVSRRTVDVRTPPTFRTGQHHPRRMLLFVPPPEGFFSPRAPVVAWNSIENGAAVDGLTIAVETGTGVFRGATLPVRTVRGVGPVPVKVTGVIHLTTPGIYRFENLWLANSLEVDDGKVELVGCAARKVEVHTSGIASPVVEASACVIDQLLAPTGRVQLEYVTLLTHIVGEAIDLSDSILLPGMRKNLAGAAPPDHGCARFSRLSKQVLATSYGFGRGNTRVGPWFVADAFGQPGCAVLHPGADRALRFGAEDGGEMGAYHQQRIALREEAMLAKLRDYMPVGLEPVLVPDPTLRCPPPTPVAHP